jgi:ariadne-1
MDCGHFFCFRCAAPAHSPCPCPRYRRGGGHVKVKWLLANTKTCPRCYMAIVKGRRMQPRHLQLRPESMVNYQHAFSLLNFLMRAAGCAALPPGVNTVGLASTATAATASSKRVTDAQRQMRRYEHYYKRFQTHDMSYKTERDVLRPALAEQAIRRLESRCSVGFMKAAQSLADSYRRLLRGRVVLSRSYVFAYYMFDAEETLPPPAGPWPRRRSCSRR